MSKNLEKTIEKLVSELLGKMGFSEAKINILKEEDVFKINLETDENRASPEAMQTARGMLIGYHGETISALQLLLSLFIYHREEEWLKILVDVGDYRAKREEQLKELALKTAQRVKFSKRPVGLSSLSSFERRVIHLFLKDDPEIVTRSEGEGRERRLVVDLDKKVEA